METHTRSIAKALSWRVVGLLLTVAAAWTITRRRDVAVSIGVIDTSSKLLAFYLHERVWLKIHFGRPRAGAAGAPKRPDTSAPRLAAPVEVKEYA